MARTMAGGSSKWLTRSGAVLTAAPLSMSCWAKPSSIAALQCLMSISDGAAVYFMLAQNTSGGASIYVQPGPAQVDQGSNSVGTWGHYACAATNTVRKAIFNGVVNSVSGGSLIPTGLNKTEIGTLWSGGASINCTSDIGEAGIWNVILDDAEFVALAAGVSPLLVRRSALIAYWPLIGTASPEIDLVGRNDLTLNNAPAQAPHCRIYYPHGVQSVARALVLRYISGITKNSAGAALGSATVKLFRTSDDGLVATTTSDGSGNYSFTVGDITTHYYIVAYKAGSPDVSGSTVNTLVGA